MGFVTRHPADLKVCLFIYAGWEMNYESAFTSRGFAIVKRVELPTPPANPRERADALSKAFGIQTEQCIKALAMQFKSSGEPFILLLPTPERLDLKVLSKLLGQDAD